MKTPPQTAYRLTTTASFGQELRQWHELCQTKPVRRLGKPWKHAKST